MNKVVLIGRLTADPDVRYSQTQNSNGDNTCVANYTLAVDRRFKRDNDQQNADFIRCVAFGKRGEFAEKYLHKGSKIAVFGHIQTGNYTNKEGVKVYTTDVIVEEQEFAESSRNADQNTQPQASQQRNQNQQAPQQGGYPQNNGYPQQQGGYPPQGGYQQGGYPQQGYPQPNDGFMNIPDGVDDEGLPFN